MCAMERAPRASWHTRDQWPTWTFVRLAAAFCCLSRSWEGPFHSRSSRGIGRRPTNSRTGTAAAVAATSGCLASRRRPVSGSVAVPLAVRHGRVAAPLAAQRDRLPARPPGAPGPAGSATSSAVRLRGLLAPAPHRPGGSYRRRADTQPLGWGPADRHDCSFIRGHREVHGLFCSIPFPLHSAWGYAPSVAASTFSTLTTAFTATSFIAPAQERRVRGWTRRGPSRSG